MKLLQRLLYFLITVALALVLPNTIKAQTATRLGGMNLDGYCSSQNQGSATINNNTWTCTSGATINMTSACQWQYPGQNATAVQDIAGNPFTWSCYASSAQSGPTATQAPTPVVNPTPTPTTNQTQTQTRLGGMNLDGYCRAQNQGGSALNGNTWTCQSGAAIDLNAACRWQYISTAMAVQEVANNPFTWACYTAGNTPTPAATPSPTNAIATPTPTTNQTQTRLGGMNLDGYCRAQNQGGSALNGNTWTCQSGAAIDLDAACRWQYISNTAVAVQEVANNPFTWACYTSGATTPTPTTQATPTPSPSAAPTPTISAGLRVRKSIYDLTPDELQRFVNAVNTLRANGTYAQFMNMHMQAMMTETPVDASNRNAAHRGPIFLPWHRAFVWEFEQALQRVDPTVTVPYWPFEQESLGATPRVFTAAYFGSDGNPAQGNIVTDGPFASWRISRMLGRDTQTGVNSLPTSLDVARVMQDTVYDTAPYDTTSRGFRDDIEGWTGPNGWGVHNEIHGYIGGDMAGDNNANMVNDPIFWLVHANIDRLWWRWQQQNGIANYQPIAEGPAGHNLNDVMQFLPTTGTPADTLDIQNNMGYTYQ